MKLETKKSGKKVVAQGLRNGAAVEYPTLFLALAVYSLWLLVTLLRASIPLWALICLGAILITIQSSLQHELVHGHPTRWRWLNGALAAPPLSLWLPFEVYRRTHVQHHINELLTDPLADPESKYFSRQQWNELGAIGRLLVRVQGGLIGRVLIGPFWVIASFISKEFKLILKGDVDRMKIWLGHAVGVAAVVAWLVFACHMSLVEYFFFFVYPGTAILLMRSFAEHRAVAVVDQRSAIVESSWFFSLLFLNNNLHAVHHKHPGIPWYQLPLIYRKHRDNFLSQNGGYLYKGYRELFSKHLFRQHDEPVHPFQIESSASS